MNYKLTKLHLLHPMTILQFIVDIPPGTTQLDLSMNLLGQNSGSNLTKILAAIPEGVKTLILTGNNLDEIPHADLVQALSAIPDGVTTLDLTGNSLYKTLNAEVQLLTAISARVTTLDLSKNHFGQKSGSELAQFMAAIPSGVITLNLSLNELGQKSGSELAQFIAAIPANVITLDLQWNELGQKSGSELAQFIAAIPAGVTTLNLGENDFYTKTIEEWSSILSKAPLHLKTIVLGYIYIKKDVFELINMDVLTFWVDLLLKKLNKLVQTGRIDFLDFKSFTLPIEINEMRLSQFINALERINSPVSLLAAGLLLDGHIPSTLIEPEDIDIYREKRLHDAISFYGKAWKNQSDEGVKDIAQFRLWEINTVEDMPSVKKRLAGLGLVPPNNFVSGYTQFNKALGYERFNQISRDTFFGRALKPIAIEPFLGLNKLSVYKDQEEDSVTSNDQTFTL